jgi:hypothetical protein
MRFFFYSFILSIFFVSNNYEISIFGRFNFNIELFLHLFLILLIFYDCFNKKIQKIYFSNVTIYFLIITCFILLFTFFDLIFNYNLNALYELNFLILLSTPFIFNYFINIKNIRVSKILYILIIYLLLKSYLNPDVVEDWDYLDTSDGRVFRTRIFGYESSTIAVILASIFFYLFFKIKKHININYIINIILLLLSLIVLAKTLSRASYFALFFGILFYFRRNIKVLMIILISISIILIFYYNSLNTIYFDRLFSLVNAFDNPRLTMWNDAYKVFTNGNFVNILFGYGFFRFTIDNTLLNIFFSRGVIGTIIYIYYFNFIYKYINKISMQNRDLIKIIFIIIFITSLFMDFFAQRKIFYILFLILFDINYSFTHKKFIDDSNLENSKT